MSVEYRPFVVGLVIGTIFGLILALTSTARAQQRELSQQEFCQMIRIGRATLTPEQIAEWRAKATAEQIARARECLRGSSRKRSKTSP